MSKMFYSPKTNTTVYKVGGIPVTSERNSFSTQPIKNQGKLTRKGLYGEINPHILRLLEKGK